MALEAELATYERLKPELLADQAKVGKYVLIKGDQLLGVYPTREEALEQGYERYLFEAFMVKQIAEVKPVYRSGIAIVSQPRRGDRE
jgi:hypothetical protein